MNEQGTPPKKATVSKKQPNKENKQKQQQTNTENSAANTAPDQLKANTAQAAGQNPQQAKTANAGAQQAQKANAQAQNAPAQARAQAAAQAQAQNAQAQAKGAQQGQKPNAQAQQAKAQAAAQAQAQNAQAQNAQAKNAQAQAQAAAQAQKAQAQANGAQQAQSANTQASNAKAQAAANAQAQAQRAAAQNPGQQNGPIIEGTAKSTDTKPSSNQTAEKPAAKKGEQQIISPKERMKIQQVKGSSDFRKVLTEGLAKIKANLAIVAIFSFAANILILAVPIYLFQISDRVLTSRSTDTLVMLTIVVAGLILAHVLLDMMRRYILMRIAVDLETRLGAPVLSAAARASYNGSSKEFQSLSDLQQLRSFITGSVLLTMLDAPVAPLYVLAVFLIHPQLGMILCATMVILLIIAIINQRMTALPFGKANAFAMRANLQSDAMARNAQVMNAMGMVPEGVQIWGRETAESLKAQVLGQDRNIFMSGISKFIRLGTQISMLGWGAVLAIQGDLTGGMIIAASIIGGRALAPVEGTIEGWRSFIQARAAYARIRSLLQSSPLNQDRLRLPAPQGRLSVERVLYVPPPNKKVILNGVSFSLEPGDSLAIVGSSGAGKSTLAKMLVGSISPTAGNVRLDMMDVRNWDPRQYGENVGFLPQDVQLFPASIKANIARMREDATDEEVFRAAELAGVHDMISEFAEGYETIVSMDGSPLSGGQRQRIGLARAFFGQPRLVVLDEPNSNLDTPGEQALARALRGAKELGMTVIAVTQRPALLGSVDKIMMLKNGSVQALGGRDEILPMITANRNTPNPKLAAAE